MPSEDELAHTATAPGSGTPTVGGGSLPSSIETLERYVIEGQLGAGGMGVVFLAFDPELERRVALKVLREGISQAAEHRLLREARAMARLAHPNVVTVYEVGTAEGRDFVAMELIDGEPLVEWLRTSKPSEREVIEAFLAAGRGLAAAHDAGIVHRDFKPHNVLRSKGGRIVVTDFGLAADNATRVVPLVASRNTPSSLSGLTEPGTMLGTPAYMAPEQWTGGAVTPATDQFAFCVALWEAFAGERPFRGDTPEVLRGAVERGPATLDASAIPRRLRSALRRGLAPDPAARWPSMAALLHAIQPRRGVLVAAIAGTAAIAAATSIIMLARADHTPSCEAPVIDPASAWSAADDALIRPQQPSVANLFRSELTKWRTERAAACKLPDVQRRNRLGCLDRVLVRLEALRRARMLDQDAVPDGIIRQLYSADVCALDTPPKLPDRYSEAAVIGLALRAGYTLDPTKALRARRDTDGDACAGAYFALLEVNEDQTLKAAQAARAAAERCNDAQVYGAALMNEVSIQLRQISTHDLDAQLREADRAVTAAAQPMLRSQWHMMLGELALDANRLDEALVHFTAAYDGPAGHMDRLHITTRRVTVLAARSRPEDLELIRREAAGWKAVLIVHGAAPWMSVALDWYDAIAAWRLGDADAAGARLVELAIQVPAALNKEKLVGVVVDEAGQPVEGATVVAGASVGDSFRGAIPSDEMPAQHRSWEIATTDKQGRYAFAGTPQGGAIVAQLGARRSLAMPIAPNARLELGATGDVHGRVRIDGERSGDLWVAVRVHAGAEYDYVATVRPDGTFDANRIPRGKARIVVKRNQGTEEASHAPREIEIGETPLVLELDAPSGRDVQVLVRSTSSLPIHQASVHALARTANPHTVRELEAALDGTQVSSVNARAVTKELSPAVRAKWKRGDLHARLSVAPESGTICVVGVQVDERDPEFWQKLEAQRAALEVKCQPLVAGEDIIVIDVPPMRRLE